VSRVAEVAVEAGQPEVDKLGVARTAEQVTEAEDVGHPGGEPQLLTMASVDAAVVVQPPELPVLGGCPGTVEEPVELGSERAAQVVVEHGVGHVAPPGEPAGTAVVIRS